MSDVVALLFWLLLGVVVLVEARADRAARQRKREDARSIREWERVGEALDG